MKLILKDQLAAKRYVFSKTWHEKNLKNLYAEYKKCKPRRARKLHRKIVNELEFIQALKGKKL